MEQSLPVLGYVLQEYMVCHGVYLLDSLTCIAAFHEESKYRHTRVTEMIHTVYCIYDIVCDFERSHGATVGSHP